MNFDDFKKTTDAQVQVRDELKNTYRKLVQAISDNKSTYENASKEMLNELKQEFCDLFKGQGFDVQNSVNAAKATYRNRDIVFTLVNDYAEISGLFDSRSQMIIEVEFNSVERKCNAHWNIDINGEKYALYEPRNVEKLGVWIEKFGTSEIQVAENVNIKLCEHISFLNACTKHYSKEFCVYTVFEPNKIPEFLDGKFNARGNSLKELLADNE